MMIVLSPPVACLAQCQEGGGEMAGQGNSSSRREIAPWDMASMVVEGLSFLAQVALAIVFYNHAGLTGLLVVGWSLLVVAMLLGWRARVDFQAKGQAPDDGSWLHTTAVVDTGIYRLVRHPMYLSFMIISLSLACLAQHLLGVLLGAILIALLYYDMVREERSSTAKFGQAYQDYMERVPRLNLLLGLLRAARHT
jgi:protein-S-isoprenylcysteine O-methyltransferase Ste14